MLNEKECNHGEHKGREEMLNFEWKSMEPEKAQEVLDKRHYRTLICVFAGFYGYIYEMLN